MFTSQNISLFAEARRKRLWISREFYLITEHAKSNYFFLTDAIRGKHSLLHHQVDNDCYAHVTMHLQLRCVMLVEDSDLEASVCT